MASRLQYDHLEFHGRQWRAVFRVPRHLQATIGKTVFKKGLGTDSRSEAEVRAWPHLREWKTLIKEAERKAKAAPLDPIVARALDYRELRDDFKGHIERDGRASDIAVMELLETEVFDDDAAEIAKQASPEKAREYLGIIKGERTPITVHIDQWMTDLDGHVKPRTLKHYADAIRHLAAFATEHGLPQTLEAFDRRAAGDFISKRFIAPKAKYKTARKYVSALSSYWRWLGDKGKLPLGSDNPWRGQRLPPRSAPKFNNDGTIEDNEPRPFTDDEVSRLLHPGKPDDPVLMEFMLIAALSGMRREEIGRIRVRDVDLLGLSIDLPRAKTKAGIRAVPLHRDLASLIAKRVSGKASSAWLFPELPDDKEGRLAERADEVGKRFVTYRRSVGVDERLPGEKRSRVDFHSFRRWFATKAEQAGILPHIIAAVVGHKTNREGMTLGTYSGGPSMEQRRACVQAVALPQVTL
ncbi:tyrosine-type recombinase/integrase [Hyphomicrobium sp. CS1BSMeth3]|uniref:tyrosine-type recombinase/integrase n=1 Tax=Hyphomicrobium sp. CS1BSMeth3 TaxID=1892844 RepID=UPI000930E4F7|nr:tyrosine-type recombinase/integrase [Hyphomicrobium sp. CS1BSMeth3]